MKFRTPGSELYVPDGTPVEAAIRRTTCAGVCAHQDDLEVMAFHGIRECFQRQDRWFAGVVMSDGAGAPRSGIYADLSDAQMVEVRAREQKKASHVGEYGSLALLRHPSRALKDPADSAPAEELEEFFALARPERVYTHNLADKHDTHVAVALAAVEACRRLPPEARPREVWGCEVWRDLDWLCDADKLALDCSGQENLQAALIGVFDSQVSGGKRYDAATMGRRKAHATFFESHEVDSLEGVTFAVDLTPLVLDPDLDPVEHIKTYVERFLAEVAGRIGKLNARPQPG